MVRVDFNVPIHKGKILDDTRILAAIPTLEYLREKGAKIILISHLGRPEGKKKKSLSLEPIAKHLAQLMGRKILFVPFLTGNVVESSIKKLKEGQILLLENTRFSKHEQGERKDELAGELASYADIFVQDCFGVVHRDDASVTGIPKHLVSYMGFLLEREIKILEGVMQNPKEPFVLVLGGAKSETKMPIIKNLYTKVDKILIGGVLFNTYLKAMGYSIGDSLFDAKMVDEAKKTAKKRKIFFPVDVVVGKEDGSGYRLVDIKKNPHKICGKGESIFDIGPMTVYTFSAKIKSAKTLVWNGAMGYFECSPYSFGTLSIARLIASCSRGKAYGIIGGGETIESMVQVHMLEYMDFISTGGGAMLEFLSGKNLPGIEALEKNI